MNKYQKMVFEKLFRIDLNKEPIELIEELDGDINADNELSVIENRDENQKLKIIRYDLKDNLSRIIILSIAAGLPTVEFLKAENIYKRKNTEKEEKNEESEEKSEYDYYLEGSLLAGSLAQYAAIMSEGYIEYCQTVTYNAIGLGNFLRFQGNEFLGIKAGLLYYLNDLYYNKRSMMKNILYKLEDAGLIKYGNISNEYRRYAGEKLREDRIKEVLIEVFIEQLELNTSKAEELINKHFNPGIVERKMRFIDRYQRYKENLKNRNLNDDKIINYVFSENIPAQLFELIGSNYIIDRGLEKFSEEIRLEFLKQIEVIEEEKVNNFKEHKFELFEPFILIKENGNGKKAKNRLKKQAEITQITNNLSYDYLRAIIKDLIVDLDSTDKNLLIEVFRKSYMSNEGLIDLIKDRLSYSIYLKGLIKEEELDYKSEYVKNKPDLFSGSSKIYPLDRAAIEQLEVMTPAEIKKLWKWKLSGDGIFLILGSELETDEEKIEYHQSTICINNQLEEIRLQLAEPSQNKVYGSLKKPVNYRLDQDIDYHHIDEDAYNFSSGQGAGFIILSTYKDPELKIKIDGSDISGTYQEKDREEANIGKRTKTLRDSYFGEDIILRDKKKSYGDLSGELMFVYGSAKEDVLIIDGFVNGDYGIELKEKAAEENDDTEPVVYTPYYKVRFDCIEYVALHELVIDKSINNHSRVSINGLIKEDNVEEYSKYLRNEDDPEIVITYGDDNSIIFKGIIYDYDIKHKCFDYHLELKAVSYSILLDRERHTRIYQNMGTCYNDILSKLNSANDKFSISFAKSSDGNIPLVNENYPVVFQYKETDWQFLRRIASYLDQVIIVDDTKDNSETISIQLGFHNSGLIDLNNVSWSNCMGISHWGTVFRHYKIRRHEHYRSGKVFELAGKVNAITKFEDNSSAEMTIIRNMLFIEKGVLYSDLTLARQENIVVDKIYREFSLTGRSYRARVKKLNNKYQAKVEFVDIEDEFKEDKAYWFNIDKIYTNAYFAPEIDDIVDVFFRSEYEGEASVRSSGIDVEKEIKQNPEDKLIKTPEGYLIKLNNEVIYISSKDEEAVLSMTEKEIVMTGGDNKADISKDEINLKTSQGQALWSKNKTSLAFGSKKLEIAGGKTKLM